MTLTDSLAMLPAASVSGLYLQHPAARYFAVGPVGRRPGRGLRTADGPAARGGRAVDRPPTWRTSRRLGEGAAA